MFSYRGSIGMFLVAMFVLAIVTPISSSSQNMTGDSVAIAFRGEWVPAKAACTSPLRLTIGPQVVKFAKGDDRVEYRNLDQCFACMGHDVQDIVILSTDARGDSPFTIYLDSSKKKPKLTIDFIDTKLGNRFRFGRAALKKCK